jgi:EmrB/QacA subfamily drug resistance transporter
MTSTASPPGTGPANSAPASTSGALSHRQILTILSGLMMGMFLASLDQTIVSTAIRTISDDLNGLSDQAWVTTAYLISSTISTPLYGKLSDIYGRKPFYLAAITIFVVGSAACTFSTSMTELAAFRAFQGLGAGGLMSLALAIIGDIVPPRQRANYQGYLLAVFATSSVAGPLIGGFLAGQGSIASITGWRWVFLVNVPVGVVALYVVARVLNVPHRRREHRIDWWGALTIAIGVVPLLLVAEQGREWGWASARSVGCYAVGAVGLLVWVLVERAMGDEALIPMRLFRSPVFSKTSVLSVFIGMGMFGGLMLIPQYLQIVKGASPTKSGLMMLPLMLGLMLASVVSGRIISRTGRYKIFPILGTALMAVAMLLFHYRVHWDTPLWETMCFMAVLGVGLGGCMQTLILAVQNAVDPKDMGVATASSTFFRQMGGTAGTAVFLTILFSTVGDKISGAFRAAARTPSFQAALHDPGVVSNPANKPVISMLSGGGSSASGNVLSDSSFIQHLDPRLAQPFKQGFAESMNLVFLFGAVVVVVAFLLVLWTEEVPLRKLSGIEAREAEANAETADGATRAAVAADAGAVAEVAAVGGQESGVEGSGVNGVPGAAVHGVLRSADGAAVPGAAVTLIDLRGSQIGQAVTDGDGRYALRAPGTGSYMLVGSAGSYGPQAATVVVDQDTGAWVDLVLSGAGVTGTVLDAPSGQPVADALVTVVDQRGDVAASVRTRADGAFTVTGLAPGPCTLTVSLSGHRPVAVAAEAVAGAAALAYEVRLDPGGRISGTIRAAVTGVPVGDARVTLLDAGGSVVGTATTGADGEYAFGDLDRGDYTVVASGYPPVARPLSLPPSGLPVHDVELGHDVE